MWAFVGWTLWSVALALLAVVFYFFFRRAEALLYVFRGLYLLRVPILIIVCVWAFCLAAFFLPGTRLLLGNAFDLDPGLDTVWLSRLLFAKEVFLVSLSACLLGSVVLVTWRLVRLYGPERFLGEDSVSIFNPTSDNVTRNIKPWHLMIFLPLIDVPMVVGAIYKSSIADSGLSKTSMLDVFFGIVAAVVGVLVSLVCLWLTNLAQRRWTRPRYASHAEDDITSIPGIVGSSPDFFLPTIKTDPDADTILNRARNHVLRSQSAHRITNFIDELLPPDAKPGYIAYDDDRNALILPGHVAAGVLLAVTFVTYLVVGILMYVLAYHTSKLTLSFVPTLCYLLLLAMLVCWGLSSLAFFFDRYRVPVLIPLVLVLLTASIVGPDYYYPTVPQHADSEGGKNGSGGENLSTPDTMIVVAANGGGIQAAAWTAQVLVGLEKECQESSSCGQEFGKSIRLISSVSGGSAGTMYFVNEYEEDGTLPEQGLEEIVTRAEGSSLDHIAWGLLYPDLARTVNVLLPWLPEPFTLDRGQALDKAWLREEMTWPKREGIEEGLSEWQEDAEAGRRPGVIFNATIAETGQRLPLSTVALPEDLPGGIRYKRLLEGIEPKPTIPVVTAARLSAAFPYVSPAARAKIPAEADAPEDGYYEEHIVDGGYYDNYGVSSLVEWLDAELANDAELKPKRIVVIQIIASPPKDELDPQEGWLSEHLEKVLYQVNAPAETALNVRNAGQSAHSQVELKLLKEKWERGKACVPIIIPEPFVFDGPDPPLSWHLTQKNKEEIKTSWKSQTEKREKVIRILTEQSENCT